MSRFAGHIVFVTGGASGIGRALGEELARRGARVTLADIDGKRAESAAAAIRAAGFSAEAVTLDVSDGAAFKGAIDALVAREGRIDDLFNNAGVGVTGEVRDMSTAAWEKIVDVNLKGVIHGIQAAYPHMVRRGDGCIANTACIAGLVPFPLTAAYCATKHAIVGLSLSLRAEAADLGVKVSVICPGTVATEMFESIEYLQVDKAKILASIDRSMVSPERCARSILRGLERNRALIPVTWHARLAWTFYRLLPGTFLTLTTAAFRRMRQKLRTI
jgi:NADP-dependent 3-hydroxy acid dehydrogenase YdfG